MKRFLVLLALCAASVVRADALQDRFDTVWESLWYQGGAPTSVVRWGGDIRVHIHGRNKSTHRGRVMAALGKVTDLAGVRLVDVSDAPDAQTQANLDVQIVNDDDLQDNQACYVRVQKLVRSRIEKAELKMRDYAVYRCVLHESMHAIGISGHPTGDTVLSYFYQRSDALTDLDAMLVRTWYSPQMRPGMSPLEAVVVLTDAVVKTYGQDSEPARAAQRKFLADTMRQMEAFGTDQGEIPVILKRSGTASTDMINRGRMLMRYFLGLAHMNGTVGPADARQGLTWLERAARDGLAAAQYATARAYERGDGVEANASEAYVWYSMAAAQEISVAADAVKRVASVMTPQEVEAAKARIPQTR